MTASSSTDSTVDRGSFGPVGRSATERPLLPLGDGLLVDPVALGQRPQALLTMLYRSTDRLCRRGAPVENLAHSASFHSDDKNAPSKPGIKHLAGFMSPLGSQNDVAGTRKRRSSNQPRQNLLSRILSSRTLVTRVGARPFRSSTKPQLIRTISRSPSAFWRTTGATWPGKIADAGSNAAPRL